MPRSGFSKLQSVPGIIGLDCLLRFMREQECLLAQLLILSVILKGPNPCWPEAQRKSEVLCVHSSSFPSSVRKVQGLYQLFLPERWSLLPLKPNSRDHVKSALLQVVLCELITVLIFISSSPSLPSPPDVVHCSQTQCA